MSAGDHEITRNVVTNNEQLAANVPAAASLRPNFNARVPYREQSLSVLANFAFGPLL
jgi:hypothetical protein